MNRKRRSHTSESGFMLLFVFLLAATAAIGLYLEIPRVAFESQRLREETLVERGLEYRRAIQLYVRKEKKYPQTIENLENTGERRYLRRRYADPMTGKDEWRLIHIGPNGEFTDSLVLKQKNPLDKEEKGNQNTFISEGPSLGDVNAGGQPGQNTVANRQRQSDLQGAPGQGALPEGAQGQQPQDPNQQQQQQQPNPYAQGGGISAPLFPQQRQQQVPQPGYPQQGYPPQGYPQQGFPQQGGQSPVGFPPAPGQQSQVGYNPVGAIVPGVGTSGSYQQPGPGAYPYQQPSSSQTGGMVPQPFPYGQQPPAYGQTPITANPAAVNAIKDMIMKPRPGGAPSTVGATGLGGTTFGGGIAGVASKFEAEGIKLISDRSKYNEWEFLYDYRRDPWMTGGGVNLGGQQGAGGMGNPGNTVGNPSNRNSSGFGGNSGFGNSNSGSGFGNSGSGGFGNSGFGNSGSGMGGSSTGFGSTNRQR